MTFSWELELRILYRSSLGRLRAWLAAAGDTAGGLGSVPAPVAHQPVGWVRLWDGNLSCSVSWKDGSWLRSSAAR